MNNLPKEYHDFVDVFSKSKAGKLADHRPYDLKITLGRRHFPALQPDLFLSQEELAALCKFIDENLVTGFISPLAPTWCPSPLHSEERRLSLTLHQFSRPQPNLQED